MEHHRCAELLCDCHLPNRYEREIQFMDKLVQLRQMTKVVADTADVEAVKRLKPMDCTTNPTIVLQALKTPIFHEDFEEALE
ncbi:transaldolase domain-containing protein (plasmid) [Rhizobium sp. CIAT894]|nr:transaldolase domain-containing protein [Rhizobium sp. CIAT894]